MKIKKVNSNFERERLIAPFGFKGGYLDELWQTVALLESESGCRGLGLGTQSVLWSDSSLFVSHSQAAGNSLMFMLTEYALNKVVNINFDTPIELLEQLYPEVYEYGKLITGNPGLRPTFALNALVAVDNAAWMLYAREKGICSFSSMIPEEVRPALSHRHDRLAAIPLITYGVKLDDIAKIAADGSFFLKIKIGSDPEKDGDLNKMLEWDKKRLTAIHNELKDITTKYTESGHIAYYLDANGRYDTKDRLMKLLDHADHIGALDRIAILEEPFPEEARINVGDIPVRLAADESAHSDGDAAERIDMGYSVIALKPIAKTLSMSFKIAQLANKKGIPCFCADLTVNPILVDWNKNMAACLDALPGIKIGVVESNGPQNYTRWQELKTFHPCCGASWIDAENGVFKLDSSFYASSGGMLEISEHYHSLVGRT